MCVNIYLADLIVSERKVEKRKIGTYSIFVKEMKNPFSVRLKTIAPTNFADSLRFLKSEETHDRFLDEEMWFRTIKCQENAQLYFVFKSVDQLYMFVIKLDLKKRHFEITSYEWNQLQQKYLRLHTNELLTIEKQLIYYILQSLYIYENKRVSYLFVSPVKKKQ
ncbi:hypothetical protein [Thermaerobacillus caldiproteolyticus]|uniref:hypothetical protein n=1 Tax=Thermaerobacillus caldiproteolyticus TaxID=247480 RepID=UPI0015EC6CAB|nr:hypothetical protein [Anoxybacillus caldiproteolyticus]